MSTPSSTDYSCLKIHHLRDLLKTRIGHVPSDCKLKRHYIARLQETEHNDYSDFLALPAEPRTKIYKELLTLETKEGSDKRTCSPQVLAVCKQIRAEAEGSLYAENQFNISLDVRVKPDKYTPRSRFMVAGDGLKFKHDLDGGERRVRINTDLPHHLLKVNHLKINITLVEPTRKPYKFHAIDLFKYNNRYLYNICSFLADSIKLKSVVVNVTRAGFYPMPLDAIMWPLVKLPTKSISFTGFLPAVTKWACTSDRKAGIQMNTYHKARDLLRKARKIHSTMLLCGHWDTSRIGDVKDVVTIIRFLLDFDDYVDEHQDESLRRAVEKVGPRINKALVNEVAAAARKEGGEAEESLEGWLFE
jgi:hypothetical protein